jgi:putative inorganic carbon (HCO3(-)) transporter
MKNRTLIDRAAVWITAGELPILLLVSPLFLFVKPSLAPVLVLLPLLWLARYHSQRHFIPRTPVDWPVLGLLAMVLVGTWLTPDLPFSLGKIAGVIYGIAIFYAIVNLTLHWRGILPVAMIVVGLGGAAALLSLLGTEWDAKWWIMRVIRPQLPQVITGVPGAESGFNPNQVSGVLIMYVPLQLSMLAGLLSGGSAHAGRHRWLASAVGLSLLLTGLVVLLAQTRAAWAALALGLALMAAIAFRRLRPLVAAAIVAGLLALALLGPVGVGEWLVQQGWMVNAGAVSWSARVELWSRGLWAIADFPLTGTGLNMFRRVVWQLYPLFHFEYGKDIGHAHETFLQVALDLGLPALVSYLALVGGTIAAGWRTYRESPRRLARLIALGGLVGLVAHLAWGFTDAVALGAKQGFLWWAVVALVVAAATQSAGGNKGASTLPDSPPPVDAPSAGGQIVEGEPAPE